MNYSGVVRNIDDLRRIMIPRDILRVCGIKEGDSLEISCDEKTKSVILKLYDDEARRKRWVNEWHGKFLIHGTAISKRVGNMTIVAWGRDIAIAICREGDTYNRRVGEAICMAKLCGERIPEYI